MKKPKNWNEKAKNLPLKVKGFSKATLDENKKSKYFSSYLMDKGVDLHSFQPSVEVSECDVFIYVGGESDEWVDDTLKNAANKNMVVVKLMDVLGDKVKSEEHVEGMGGNLHEKIFCGDDSFRLDDGHKFCTRRRR